MEIRSYRIIDYYDLIEFPSGRHYPVPKAIKEFGWNNILKIPVAEKKRDFRFYFCEACKEWFCSWCDEYDCDGDNPDCIAGYSFFKCRRHTAYGLDTERKKALLEIFFRLGYHDLLRYIEVDPKVPYAGTKGYAIVAECTTTSRGIRLVGDFKYALDVNWDFYPPHFDSIRFLDEIEKIKEVRV